jgi:hypothetical protein
VTACGACPLPFYLRGRVGAAITVLEAASETRRSFNPSQYVLDPEPPRRGCGVGGGGCQQLGTATEGHLQTVWSLEYAGTGKGHCLDSTL